ncbi:MAG: Tfp pilus assembly protein FimT/FimU [Marinicella pacifica]
MVTHQHKKLSGFTLIEVLLVVIIIGIMTTVGVGLVNSQSGERTLQNKAQQWQQLLTYLCQQSVLNNRSYGIEFAQQTAGVFVYEDFRWRELPRWSEVLAVDTLSWEVSLDGHTQPLETELSALPHLVCYSDGRINPFRLKLWLTQLPASAYELTSQSPFKISGHWHE